MAKKKNKEVLPVEKQNETVIDKKEEQIIEKIEDVKEEIIVEDIIEETIVVEEKPKKVKKEELKQVSFKEIFEKSLEITPFVIFQNGIMICRWKPNVRIECVEDGFTINHIKYSYQGIEIKHV